MGYYCEPIIPWFQRSHSQGKLHVASKLIIDIPLFNGSAIIPHLVCTPCWKSWQYMTLQQKCRPGLFKRLRNSSRKVNNSWLQTFRKIILLLFNTEFHTALHTVLHSKRTVRIYWTCACISWILACLQSGTFCHLPWQICWRQCWGDSEATCHKSQSATCIQRPYTNSTSTVPVCRLEWHQRYAFLFCGIEGTWTGSSTIGWTFSLKQNCSGTQKLHCFNFI